MAWVRQSRSLRASERNGLAAGPARLAFRSSLERSPWVRMAAGTEPGDFSEAMSEAADQLWEADPGSRLKQ